MLSAFISTVMVALEPSMEAMRTHAPPVDLASSPTRRRKPLGCWAVMAKLSPVQRVRLEAVPLSRKTVS